MHAAINSWHTLHFCGAKLIAYNVSFVQTYGHDKISILDGGLPKWVAKGLPTVSGAQHTPQTRTFKASFRPQLYRTMEQMLENLSSKKEQVYIQATCMHLLSNVEREKEKVSGRITVILRGI